MIYLYMLGLALLLMLPMAFAFSKGSGPRNRREAAMALHRGQLAELSRDLADNRIAANEYAAARLEVERRLLAADSFAETPFTGNAKFLLIVTVIAVPIMAFVLYLPGSTATIPSEPHAQWLAKQQAEQAKIAGFILAIRARLAGLDPNSAAASEGEAYLAEGLAEQAGQITPQALAYFKQSLANAPAGAPWRILDEQRLAQSAQP